MIDPREVQSLVIRPRSPAAMRLTFLRFEQAGFLAELLRQAAVGVTFAADLDADPSAPTRHLAVTGAGLQRLRVGDRALGALPRRFLDGMGRAAHRLGDAGASDPEHWVEPFARGDAPVDAVLIDSTPDRRSGEDPRWPEAGPLDAALAKATTVVWEGGHLDGREHFGFHDGLSDPVIEGSGRTVTPGNGVWDPARQAWRAVRPGEALLGHVDERGVVAGHPAAAAIERDGSYLVIRRLQQHVGRFWSACEAIGAAVEPPLTAEEVAEQFVGRRLDDGGVLGIDPTRGNDVLYRTGPGAAVRVPPTSHIRRANPRDDLEAADLMVPRHLLFRRGIPYGPPVPRDELVSSPGCPPAEDPPPERGLLFLALCADIARQFEFVQNHWLQDGNRLGLGFEPDGLTGNRTERETASNVARTRVSVMRRDGSRATVSELPGPSEDGSGCPISSFVTTRGGEYALLPGRAALEHLASLGPR